MVNIETKSQNYIPMLNDSLYWDVAYADMNAIICESYGFQGAGPYRYAVDQDININGYIYKTFKAYSFFTLQTQPSPNCPPFAVQTFSSPVNYYMREDTAAKKVYLLDQGQEVLWYDFDAQVGDTLSYPGIGDFVIDSIYTVTTLDGLVRNVFSCENSGISLCGLYVEGIGGIMGPFHPPFHIFEFGPWLMCVSDFNQNPIYSPDGSPECYSFTTGIPSLNDAINPVTIFPNPAKDRIYLKNLKDPQSVKVYDVTGKEFRMTLTGGENSLDISALAAGWYYVCLVKDNVVFPVDDFVKL